MNLNVEDTEELAMSCWDFRRWQTGLRTKKQLLVHLRSCQKCYQWTYENDREWFDLAVLGAINSKRQYDYSILEFARSHGYLAQQPKDNKTSRLLTDIMRSSVEFKIPDELLELPKSPGVYILAIKTYDETKAIYVGKTANSIRERWAQHHLANKLNVLLQAGIGISMYCLLMPMADADAIEKTEAGLIEVLQPGLNKQNYIPDLFL